MGNITISLEDNDEKILRGLAKEKYKNKKGAMAKVIGESLGSISGKSLWHRAMERQFRLMEKGFDFGGMTISKREEIYDRR
ncbi:MAG: hypothetical protein NUV57_05080 [archaeon]|nr:hypothetical protein [archaeon]